MHDFYININLNRSFITVKIVIPVTLEVAISFTNSFSRLGKELDIYKVIIDIRSTKSISSVSDKYFYAYKYAKKSGLTRGWSIAILKDINDTSPDFLDTVMSNAGYYFKIFDNEKAALDWFSP